MHIDDEVLNGAPWAAGSGTAPPSPAWPDPTGMDWPRLDPRGFGFGPIPAVADPGFETRVVLVKKFHVQHDKIQRKSSVK